MRLPRCEEGLRVGVALTSATCFRSILKIFQTPTPALPTRGREKEGIV